MKYFTYELIAATNEWIPQTAQELRLAEKRLDSSFQKYQRELETIRPRIAILYIYEPTAVSDKVLQLGFLFASGASFVIQFERLVFRRRRIKREYEPGKMYS